METNIETVTRMLKEDEEALKAILKACESQPTDTVEVMSFKRYILSLIRLHCLHIEARN